MQKITLTVTNEANTVLKALILDKKTSKSRLVENYLREHPLFRRKLAEIRREAIKTCALCGNAFEVRRNIKIETPQFGIICYICWAAKMGKFIETHPIVDRKG